MIQAYRPGFMSALQIVIDGAKTRREREDAAATLWVAQLRPEMCDKFLLLDMREPFGNMREHVTEEP